MEKHKYATTVFSGISKRAYMKVEKDFFEFLDDIHNAYIYRITTDEEFYSILIDLDRYTEFDRVENDPLTDKGVGYIDALNKIIAGARAEGLNALELEGEE